MALYLLEKTNTTATLIVSTNTVGLRGLAIDPATGKFYSAYCAPHQTEQRGIVEIDPTTGAVFDIGGTGAFVGLAFDLAGQLYGVENAGAGYPDCGYVYPIIRVAEAKPAWPPFPAMHTSTTVQTSSMILLGISYFSVIFTGIYPQSLQLQEVGILLLPATKQGFFQGPGMPTRQLGMEPRLVISGWMKIFGVGIIYTLNECA